MLDAGAVPETLFGASSRVAGCKRSRVGLAWFLGLAVLVGCISRDDDTAEKHAWEYVSPPVITPSQAAQESFCKAVAAQTAVEPFDEATRTRIYADSYSQCLMLYNGI
jgi:hypothetical protein